MADDRIIVEIKSEVSSSEDNEDAGLLGAFFNANSTKSGTFKQSDAAKKQKAVVNFALNLAQQSMSVVMNQVQYEVNKRYTLQEDYFGQQDYTNTLNSIQGVASIGGSIVGGAAMGYKAGGIPGAIIGAVAGGAFSIVTAALNFSHRLDQAKIQLATSKQVNAFQMARLGLIDGGRGTEN